MAHQAAVLLGDDDVAFAQVRVAAQFAAAHGAVSALELDDPDAVLVHVLLDFVAGVTAIAYTVDHPSCTPSLALRIECDGKVLAYTGDTEWVDALIEVGHEADLLVAECYTYDRKIRFHLDYATLRKKLPLIGAKRVVLTHMSTDMIARAATIEECEAACDGFEIILD